MIKKLDQYLLRRFLSILIISLLGFLCVFIIVDLIENLDRYIDNKMPLSIILRYYGYSVPYFINLTLPMSMMISAVFSIGMMVKRNEWTAMKSGGISLYRLAAPLFVLSILISIISFQFDNTLVSTSMSKRNAIEKEYMKRNPRHNTRKSLNDIFFQKNGNQNISIARYNILSTDASDVTMISFADSLIHYRIDAKKISWIDSAAAWAVSNYSIRSFDQNGKEKLASISASDTLMALQFNPDDITRGNKHPDELSYSELKERVVFLKENGVDPTRWEVQRHFKLAFSFTNFIVVLFGIPLMVMKPKSGLAFGGGISFLVIFSYYAFIKFGQSLGINGVIAPVTSAWIGNVIFILSGLLLLLSVRK